MKRSRLKRSTSSRYSIMLLTLLALTGMGCVYYFFYLSDRESSLDRHYYHAIERIQTNITANIDAHKSMVVGNGYTVSSRIKKLIETQHVDPKNNQALVNKTGKIKAVQQPESLVDKKEDRKVQVGKEEKLAIDSVFREKGGAWNNGRSGLDLVAVGVNDAGKNEKSSIENDSINENVFYFIRTVESPFPFYLKFRITLDALVDDLLRKDIFDEFLILKDDKIVESSFSSGLTVLKYDSLFNLNQSGKSTAVPVLKASGNSYRCYTQPFKIDNKSEWKVVGLISSEKFSALKHDIPRSQRFMVFIFLVIAILAIPFIKSLVMSRTERMNTSDVIFSVFSLVLMVSIIALIAFDCYLQFSSDAFETETRLHKLSDNVYSNVKKEVSDMYAELGEYEKYVERKCGSTQQINPPINIAEYTATHYPDYSFLYMVDSTGKTAFDLREPNYRYDVSKRTYFERIKNKQYSYLPDGNDPYVFDVVFSLREGQLKGVLARPYEKDPCGLPVKQAVITTEMKSVTAPIIPSRFGFCIIDKGGNVIFHSDKRKSLNENFLEECEWNSALSAAISGRSNCDMDVSYSLVPTKMCIRPLPGLDYYLVTFADSAPIDDAHGQVFGISMVFEMVIIFIYLCIGFVFYFSSAGKSDLRIPRFNFAFVLPKRDHKNRYVQSTFFNLMHMFILLFISLANSQPILLLFVFFTSPIFVVLYNYFLISDNHLFEKRNYWLRNPRLWIAALALFMINFSACDFLQYPFFFFSYELAVFGLYLATEKIKQFPFIRKDVNHHITYMMMIYSIVLLICVLPVIRFSVLTYDKECEIAVKSGQIEMANAYSRRISFLSENIQDDKKPSEESINRGNYAAAFYETEIRTTKLDTAPIKDEERVYDNLHSEIRTSIQSSGARNSKLRFGTFDNSWQWSRVKDKNSQLQLVSSYTSDKSDNKPIVFVSDVHAFHFPVFFFKGTFLYALRFWLLFFILLYLSYYILNIFVRKLFALEAFEEKKFTGLDVRFFKETRAEYRIFVTGLPCSGKSYYFNNLYKDTPNFSSLDLISYKDTDEWRAAVNDVLSKDTGILLIDHFEYDCMNDKTNMLKLELLESLAQKQGIRVVIVSSIHPQAFLQLYSSPGVTEQKIESDENLHTGDRWNKALSCFYNLWFPIQGIVGMKEHKLITLIKTIPKPLQETIQSECDNGFFLRKIGEELCYELAGKNLSGNRKEIAKEKDDLVLKIQKIAHVYYLSIWSVLTKEEQYVLFDLAQDGLVNPKNLDVIDTLVLKGLVVYKDSLLLMNKSFRNFIMSVIEPADMMKMEQAERDAGNWDKFKKPLLIVVITIIVFVLQSDHSEYFTYITGFAAAIPLVIGLITSLGKFGSRQE